MASLEDLIPTVNKLQDVMYDAGIDTLDLPILAVVGSQSSGKSSILETLVGKDFLPRGTGIVTRRPLVLQLNNIAPDSPLISEYVPNDTTEGVEENGESEMTLEDHLRKNNKSYQPPTKDEWGEFLHLPGRRFYNFKQIRQEIANETARIAGKDKGISKVPINLKIFSPHVLNLTLVDLPGITKVPIGEQPPDIEKQIKNLILEYIATPIPINLKIFSPHVLNLTLVDLPGITKVPIGEQPPDIEKQIKNLILEYIATPSCVILAVSPANVDLVNSESLKLAREVDPHGKRTIGVITKLDLMDSGTNALDILSGKLYPLRLGFVGVVNRSQQDIQLNKSVEEALDNEQEYFNRHPVYRTISGRCGTRYLAKLLNQILMSHIRDKLPDIKARLNTLIGQSEQELASLGDTGVITNENRAGLVLQLMNKFATNFISSIDGTSSDISTKELCGGARIYYIYNNIFGNSLKSISPTANLTVMDIRTAIRNSTGPRPSLFVPELAFDLLVKPQIKLLLDPSQRCVELVYEELMKICHNCGNTELARYPKLHSMLIEVVSDLLRERLGPTRSYVESLIEIHRSYINTNHPNFLSATEAMADIVETRKRNGELIARQKLQQKREFLQKEIQKEKAPDVAMESNSDSGKAESDSTADSESDEDGENADMKHSKDSFLKYFFGKEQNSQGGNSAFSNSQNQNRQQYAIPNDINGQTLVDMNNLSINGGGVQNTSDDGEDNKEPSLTEREELECELIRRLIVSYFDIIRQMIEDQIPKAVMCLLVNYSKESVQNRLVTKLYKESMFDELLMEDQALAQEREKCVRVLETYRKASNIIGGIL
ncbi:probable DNM1-Dynamin-related protein [Zygosaccharomyces bailii ISA1307]|nr:probable DNM1-Dynamin-related protein [Zygosaccharomyces bailii ISA1307]